MVCKTFERGCEERGDEGADVVQAVLMCDLFGGFEGEDGVRKSGLTPCLQGLQTREGVPGGVDFDSGIVR